jgi:ubiquinone/menaquinone biosynthesis C-methylase UbiE
VPLKNTLRQLDPRRLLDSASLYRAVQLTLAPRRSRVAFIADYVAPQPGDRILDIGCGPADDLAYMPESVKYTGLDLSERYIDAARRRWGTRGEFYVKDVSEASLPTSAFDIVIANGVLHHLSDEEVLNLLKFAKRVLSIGGRLVTKDPVFIPSQRPIARFLADRDRGQNVRDIVEYVQLVTSEFPNPKVVVRSDLLRLPYDHIVMVMNE